MSKFKSGDRVKYTGSFTPSLRGETGTVDGKSQFGGYIIKWDRPGVTPPGVLAESITKIPDAVAVTDTLFKAGDRVFYRHAGGSYRPFPHLEGKTGTIEVDQDPYSRITRVRFDHDGKTSPVFAENVKRADKPGDTLRLRARLLDDKAKQTADESSRLAAEVDRLTREANTLRDAANILDANA